ncbi:TerD family protein, partial [Streptomyces recifensis]
MTPGSNVPLPATRVTVDVAAPVRLDVSGLLLAADGKVRSDDDFIFYNQPAGPGVTYRSGGGSAPDSITVDTGAVPPEIEKIVVTASPDAAGQTFQGIEPTATIRDADGGAVVASFTPPGLGAETALVVVEIYRRNGQWKARAVGQGYANGLAGIATDFGVTVEEPAQPVSAPPVPRTPPAPQAPPAPTPGAGKINLDKGRVSLQKNQTVSLVKGG